MHAFFSRHSITQGNARRVKQSDPFFIVYSEAAGPLHKVQQLHARDSRMHPQSSLRSVFRLPWFQLLVLLCAAGLSAKLGVTIHDLNVDLPKV